MLCSWTYFTLRVNCVHTCSGGFCFFMLVAVHIYFENVSYDKASMYIISYNINYVHVIIIWLCWKGPITIIANNSQLSKVMKSRKPFITCCDVFLPQSTIPKRIYHMFGSIKYSPVNSTMLSEGIGWTCFDRLSITHATHNMYFGKISYKIASLLFLLIGVWKPHMT